MKKYLLILIMLIFVGCIKQQRNDRVVYTYNLSIPEKLSFKLETQTILPESTEAGLYDSSKSLFKSKWWHFIYTIKRR